MAKQLKEPTKEEVQDNSEPFKLPSDEHILKMKGRVDPLHQKAKDASMKYAEVFRECEGYGIHKKAFNDALKLSRMEPTKADEYLAHFDKYRETLGLNRENLLTLIEGGKDEETAAAE